MLSKAQEQHTAGPQLIGFDYQFYLFMLLLLELKHGQKIGFEVKDDIHIDKPDGTTILLQAKHTVQKNTDGSTQNLTMLDVDLWKSLNNWANFIKNETNFLSRNSFVLVTNKNENYNKFLDALSQFKVNSNIDDILNELKGIKGSTQDKTLKKYIQNVSSLGKKRLKSFFSKLTIETSTDDIIKRIENKILERVMQDKYVEPVYESLSSNLHTARYLEIKGRKKFEVSFDDFKNKFGGCFSIAFEKKGLPKRNFPVLLPDDIENQTFIRQLIDIGEIENASKDDIVRFTTQMLKFLNDFTFWSEEKNFFQLTDIEEFEDNSIQIWYNEFRAKYRQIKNRINSGIPLSELEDEIKNLGINLVDFVRKQDLSIAGYLPLGVEYTNGHYYALSDRLKIGWHYDWENKYKDNK